MFPRNPMNCEIHDENVSPRVAYISHHATGEEVTADINSTATDDEGRLNPTGSLHYDIVDHESTIIKRKHNNNKRIQAKRCKLGIIGQSLCEHIIWAGPGQRQCTLEDSGKLLFSGTDKWIESGVPVYLQQM